MERTKRLWDNPGALFGRGRILWGGRWDNRVRSTG
jgi:hypothetical protein